MGYCAIADMVSTLSDEKLRQLTDDAKTGAYDSVLIQAEIDNAQEEIDSYCRTRYGDSMPFATTPGPLKAISCDITAYRLYKRRGRVPEEISAAYAAAVRKLDNIAKGVIDLGLSTGGIEEDGLSISFTDKTPEDRIFRNPEGY